MDLLGSERTYHFSTMGELVLDYEIDRDNPLQHGWWIEGTWGDNVPIVAQILQWNDFTNEAHMEFNGMGTTPNEDYLIYIEEDIRVVETAMVVHNLLTGARLGMNLELAWLEANDDDSDGITSIPLALPTRVIEDPGHEFFDDNGLYQDYSQWCDFTLTQEGQWRAEDRWTAECEGGIDLCIRGFCNGQNGQDGDWGVCILEDLFGTCGIYRDTGLGLEYQQYLDDLKQCDVNLRDCLMLAGGISVVGGSFLVRETLKNSAKKILRCRLFGIPASVCIGGTVISVGWKLWGCWDDYNLCKSNADRNWKRAQDKAIQDEIDRQCGVPAP